MKIIYKYPLQLGLNEIELPLVKILSVIQQMQPTLYAIIDPECIPSVKIQIIVAGTGWELEDNVSDGDFIGTVTDGMFVWHVFYKQI